MQNKQYICEVFKDMSIYGFGRNFISLGAKLFYFRKIKSPSIFALRSKVSLILPTSAVERQQHNLVIVNPCHSVIIGYNITGPLADHRLHCNRAIG